MKRLFIVMGCVALLTNAVFAEDTSVVARIGEQNITMADFQRWVSYNPEPGREALLKDNKKKAAMLHQIITGMVIADIARKEGFDKRPDIEEKMDHMINNFLTLEYLDKVVSAEVKASEEDIQEYYDQHRDEFRSRESVHARHILIKTDKATTQDEKAEARNKAEGILKKIRDGGDFQALAAEHSEDPGSKDRGGDLGLFGRGRMVREFEDVAFALKLGEVSDVVETKFGYHIIRVEDRREKTSRPVDEVRSIIENKLTKDRRRQAVDEFVQKAMKDAEAEVDVRALIGSDPHFGK